MQEPFSHSCVAALAVEVIALMIEFVDRWKARTWLRRVCKRFDGAVVWLVENEVSRQINDDGLWTLTNIHRKNRQIMCSLSHMSALLSQSIRGLNLSCWSTFRDEDMTLLVGHFSALTLEKKELQLPSSNPEEELVGQSHTEEGLLSLNLSYCTMLSRKSFESLPTLAPNLTSLSLIACQQLTEEDMKSITRLTSLRELHLSGCYRLRNPAAFDLHRLENLITLTISGTNIESLGFLRNLPQLQTLNVANVSRLTLPRAPAQSVPSALKSVNLSRSSAAKEKEFLINLSSFPNIVDLDLSGSGIVTDDSLKVLVSFSKLQRLNISGTFFRPIALEHLKNLTSLTFLNLCWCRAITDAQIDVLSQLPQLETLVLTGCELLTDRSMTSLAKMRNLRSVSLKGCNRISSDSVAGLEGLGVRVRLWD